MMRCLQSGAFSTTHQNDRRWCVLRHKVTPVKVVMHKRLGFHEDGMALKSIQLRVRVNH